MASGMRRAAALVVAAVVAMGLALIGTAAADENHGKDRECSFGEARGEGTAGAPGDEATAIINTFGFEVCRTGEETTDVTGTFRAAGSIPPSDAIILNGPVTCADIRGNSVGFVYPVAEGSTIPGVTGNADVLITATDGGPGGGDTITFTPGLKGQFGDDCAPTVVGAPQPVTQGDIVVTPRD